MSVCSRLRNVMRDLLEELVADQPVLRKAPLKTVICQLRFQEVLGLSAEDVRPLQKTFAQRYPMLEREEGLEMNLAAEGLQPTGNVRRTFRFRDSEHHWTVTLTPDSLAIETNAYAHFRDFAERWCHVAEATVHELEIPMQDRLGLRYINQLPFSAEPTQEQLAQLVRPELVSLVGAHEVRTSQLLQSQQEARFVQEDGVLTLRHGLMPASDSGRAYILDFDYYDEEPKALDLQEQIRTLVDFNHGIYDLFQWCVTEDTFASFDPDVRSEANA